MSIMSSLRNFTKTLFKGGGTVVSLAKELEEVNKAFRGLSEHYGVRSSALVFDELWEDYSFQPPRHTSPVDHMTAEEVDDLVERSCRVVNPVAPGQFWSAAYDMKPATCRPKITMPYIKKE